MQQAAEKLLKALLTEAGVKARRTHDLHALQRSLPAGTTPLAEAGILERATGWLNEIRYGFNDDSAPPSIEVVALLNVIEAYLARRGW